MEKEIRARILGFGRKNYGQWMRSVKKIYSDGTFLITPPLFTQVFSISTSFPRHTLTLGLCGACQEKKKIKKLTMKKTVISLTWIRLQMIRMKRVLISLE
uniref:LAGLIDADG homing endonuclease n=1 Tax=Ditylenchus dipsaci TaxID=166011 RepID=A0A915ELV2_9BILA